MRHGALPISTNPLYLNTKTNLSGGPRLQQRSAYIRSLSRDFFIAASEEKLLQLLYIGLSNTNGG